MREYDDIPHNYGDYWLYQVEGEFIDIIAEHPDITMTEISGTIKQDSKCVLSNCPKTQKKKN